MKRDSWSGRDGSTNPPTWAASEGIDVTHLLNELRARWVLIAACGVGLFAIVLGATMFSRMTFRSTARLYLGEVGRSGQGTDGMDLSGGEASSVATEVEILRTRYLIERAVLESGANVLISTPGWTRPRYWQWRLSARDLDTLEGADGKLLAIDTSMVTDRGEAATYEVRFATDMDYMLYRDGAARGGGKLGAPLVAKDLKLTLVRGGPLGPKAGETYQITVLPTRDVVDNALSSLEIGSAQSASGDAVQVLTLAFSSADPFRAARFLAALMRAYLEERQQWKTEDASAAEAFVSKQLQKMRSSLDGTQEKLANYKSENRGVISEAEASAMVEQLGRYEEQRVAARLEVSALRDLRRALSNPNAPLEAFMFGETDDAVLQGMARSLSEERRKLVELGSMFKDAAPDVKQQQAKVNAQMRMVRNYVDNRISRARAHLGQLGGIIKEYEERLRTLPGAEAGLTQIGRESEVYSKMFSYLLERQQQTAILKASTVSKNRVLDLPVVPTTEDAPALPLRLASGLLGLLLGALVVIGRVLVSSALCNDTEVRMRFPRTPVLASVPLRTIKRREQPGKPPLYDVLAGGIEGFTFTEAFRTLRTNLLNVCQDEHGKVVLVTSPAPGDGKTVCVLSLAAILAADGRRVLVVDGDLRKPSHHVLTEVRSGAGLNGYIRGEIAWRNAVQTVPLSRGSFDLMPARPQGSAELLSSARFSRLLVEARSVYDFVLVDVASYPLASDALALAKQVDLVVSVLRLRRTPRRAADEHVSDLSSIAHRHAIVLNNSQRIGKTYGWSYGTEPEPFLESRERPYAGVPTPPRLQ